MSIKIAIDRGGTFTDVYADHNGDEFVFKLLSSDPANYADAPTEGIRRVLERVTGRPHPRGQKLDISDVESVRMGTTVATNALLERKGERVALYVTKGFRDVLTIGAQARPAIFDLTVAKLEHLAEVVREVNERVTPENFSEGGAASAVASASAGNGAAKSEPGHGEAPRDSAADAPLVEGSTGEPLRVLCTPDLEAVRRDLQADWDAGITSVAIAFLHSYMYPEHELAVAKVAREIGFRDVSVSSQIQPMIKIVSRANSASADAYLSPITTRYIETIGEGFEGGLAEVGHKLLFMQSDGGLTNWRQFSGLKAILSGPAGGVVGYARTAFRGKPLLGFDMGGTSTDVSRYNGTFEHVFETTTAQVTVQAPQLDIQTVAAGGGSILHWKNGLFVVGPDSASAHPGPACYRKGGPLTVTDANLFLGRIDVDSFPHIFGPDENQPLDTEIVREKFNVLTREINADKTAGGDTTTLTAEQVALGFLTVANEAMSRPIRSLTEGKGHSTANHVLASFGGAGGQHACEVARILGISDVVIYRYSSILSAYGMALADVVADVQRPESLTLEDSVLPGLAKRLDVLAEEATANLIKQGFKRENVSAERFLNLRYQGSETFMMVRERDGGSFRDDFIAQHRQEFGFSLERDVLVGDIRVRATAASRVRNPSELLPQDIPADGGRVKTASKKQKMYFDGAWHDANLFLLADLQDGDAVAGPAMILDDTQTLVVTPGSRAHIGAHHVTLRVGDAALADISTKEIDPVLLSVFGHRFMSIAEQMGKTLQQTSISTNIKERLDFSCALFSPDGGLVANAPHIPVHLGSMSSAIAAQKEKWAGKLQDGDVLVANHPAFGGTHLPDITVITPVFDEAGKEVIFWTASRGHHSDIGGITAGSMPPFSNFLWQEGAMIEGHKVVSGGKFDHDGVVRMFYDEPAQYPGCSGSRSLQDSISDLKAQIAANNKGIALIKALIADYGLQVVQFYMQGIQDNAERSVRALLKQVARERGTKLAAEDFLDDGTPIALAVTIDPQSGSAVFDFEGTGPQIYGNLNAPKAITMSAILYCLRSMITEDIPLNQGCLVPLDIRIPAGTVLAPAADAATVGGNVETSQRVTDVVFSAFGAVACSQGTCNNFTFGFGGERGADGKVGRGFGYYETIAGGAGAGPRWDGQSGVQVHMTNTRSTDAEIFEKRYPVILHEFALRRGSGGTGRHRGGAGVVRDIEFRHPVQASILSERRARGPRGLAGGGAGAPGLNLWIRDGRAISISGKATLNVRPGERIVLQTPGGGGYGEAGVTKPKAASRPGSPSVSTRQHHSHHNHSHHHVPTTACAIREYAKKVIDYSHQLSVPW